MNELLQKYVKKFSQLRRGTTVYGPAPHKPVLLLAVIQGIDDGWISENRIELSPELVGAFKTIWHATVSTPHAPLIAQPFFYMRGEEFWHHMPNPGFEKWVQVTRNCQAIGVLHKAVAYAKLNDDLFTLLFSPVTREFLKQALLRTYFPATNWEYPKEDSYLNVLAQQMRESPGSEYAAKIRELQETLDKNSLEEELFIRSGWFQRQVPLAYENTCCISGLRVETTVNASLLDACHIVPFSQSHDDTISNGLSLCPTLHRAFDRGLIAVNPESLTVIISDRLAEPSASVYSIRQFAGREIRRPSDRRCWPSEENLHKHLLRFQDNFLKQTG
mgnify:CR=1 FL=1